MRAVSSLLTLSLAAFLSLLPTALAVEDKCPKDEYACHDVINSSLCLSQNAAAGDAETLANCVTYDNGMSDLPGAQKLCRCTGCHAAYINEAIERLFPPPCA